MRNLPEIELLNFPEITIRNAKRQPEQLVATLRYTIAFHAEGLVLLCWAWECTAHSGWFSTGTKLIDPEKDSESHLGSEVAASLLCTESDQCRLACGYWCHVRRRGDEGHLCWHNLRAKRRVCNVLSGCSELIMCVASGSQY